MSLIVASLNSGSNGNCYYVEDGEDAVLIDAGISSRETEKRMKRMGLSLKKVRGIFITHEHSDHIGGVAKLSKRHKIPVFITQATRLQGRLKLEDSLCHTFKAHEPITLGNLSITPIPKLHDAVDPHSFVVASQQVRVGFFTDTGAPCEHLITSFAQCHAAFLEANYDEEMLEYGGYPYGLKNRIRGGHGHLSNKQALALFLQHRPSFMSHLFLAHLSNNNNTPKKVKDLFDPVAGATEIVITPRDKETKLYHIRASGRLPNMNTFKSQQLSLFQ
ncbi:MAG: MBL fold metallo-hydrolase [Cyclobacteriaceae bacterium]|nr:MBL fold metallo-hydrolase [Cyclobacteriaceae bacterium]